ncbi:MAG: DUF5668 domain-containing protein [Nitriliruptorales bacterium]|nr:DUF5668 domain-containing protein [Nitriliruptorales bacterium]
MNKGRALVGVSLIGLGAIFLLDQAGTVDAGDVIGDWWPVLFLVAAALDLLARPARPASAAVFALLGAVLLAATTGVLDASMWAVIWPLGIIALGAWLVIRRSPSSADSTSSDDTIDVTVLFSGRRVVSTSRPFRGGTATALFGGVEIDLTSAELAPDATLDAVAIFGGVDIEVPPGCNVRLDGPAIFGGHESHVPVATEPDAPTLRVNATAIFGGVDVKLGVAPRTVTNV